MSEKSCLCRQGVLVGTSGVEYYRDVALLRSLCVSLATDCGVCWHCDGL